MGWRFFFYANEGNEPIHIHCQKAEKECKYWIDRENFSVDEAYSYNMLLPSAFCSFVQEFCYPKILFHNLEVAV